MTFHQILVISLTLLAAVNCQLKVFGPDELKDKFTDGMIATRFANFGYIPYGHSLFGNINTQLKVSNMCKPLKQKELNKIHHGKEITSATFILVERGGDCSFTTKVRNVEDAGASLAIIIDNKDEELDTVNMADDGAGSGIRIPSMLISKRDGQRIVEYIKSEQANSNDSDTDSDDDENDTPVDPDFARCAEKEGDDRAICEADQLQIAREEQKEKRDQEEMEAEKDKDKYEEGILKFLATFNMTSPDNHVEYSIWMSSSNQRALDFIEDFKPYAQRFGDQAEMTPHYNFWKCNKCEKEFLEDHCFGGGKYCAKEVHHKKLKGTEIMLEDLRELCIYKEAYKSLDTRHQWWDYIAQTNNQCGGSVGEICSKTAHTLTGLDFETTQKCVEDSFSVSAASSNGWTDSNVVNTLMDAEIKVYEQFKTTHFPQVVINDQTFRGQLEIEAVMNGICAGFMDPPAMCHRLLDSNDFHDAKIIFLEDDEVAVGKVLAIISSLVLGVAIIVCLYRRHRMRTMKYEINEQIESQVAQYSQIRDNSTEQSV